jgi:radical SAM superfamily enzyme YgiQ (UPF0313 family)
MKKILFINPWIYDFAAYDLWIKPWGLLKLYSIIKSAGYETYLLDALDRHHALIEGEVVDKDDGTGKFYSEKIEKPLPLRNVPRTYRRYGLPVDLFKNALPGDADIILVSSGMTYWYPGVFKAISLLREKYPSATIVLGGIYASLCTGHAEQNSGADLVLPNRRLRDLENILDGKIDLSFRNILDTPSDLSVYDKNPYAVLRLSLGCPYDCSYCAQKQLGPGIMFKPVRASLSELSALVRGGVRRFAFYDDALLCDNRQIISFLSNVSESMPGLSFYTPNGLHARFLSLRIAELMKKAGFVNPILSLESASDSTSSAWHSKVNAGEVERAVRYLRKAGYRKGEYTLYLLLGAGGSEAGDVRESMQFAHSLGARISLSEFSPVPGTEMARRSAPWCLREPLLQNNSIFPTFAQEQWEKVAGLKKKAVELNRLLHP